MGKVKGRERKEVSISAGKSIGESVEAARLSLLERPLSCSTVSRTLGTYRKWGNGGVAHLFLLPRVTSRLISFHFLSLHPAVSIPFEAVHARTLTFVYVCACARQFVYDPHSHGNIRGTATWKKDVAAFASRTKIPSSDFRSLSNSTIIIVLHGDVLFLLQRRQAESWEKAKHTRCNYICYAQNSGLVIDCSKSLLSIGMS